MNPKPLALNPEPQTMRRCGCGHGTRWWNSESVYWRCSRWPRLNQRPGRAPAELHRLPPARPLPVHPSSVPTWCHCRGIAQLQDLARVPELVARDHHEADAHGLRW